MKVFSNENQDLREMLLKSCGKQPPENAEKEYKKRQGPRARAKRAGRLLLQRGLQQAGDKS